MDPSGFTCVAESLIIEINLFMLLVLAIESMDEMLAVLIWVRIWEGELYPVFLFEGEREREFWLIGVIVLRMLNILHIS